MVEVVTIEKFKSKDGYVYDNLKDAERADRRWTEANVFDATTEVAELAASGRHMLNRMIHKHFFETGRKNFPRLVIFHGKHGDNHTLVVNPGRLPEAYLAEFKLQQPYNHYDSDAKSAAVAQLIFDTDNAFAAMAFMDSRVSYQYENITSEYIYALV